jgi:hypothetical protein
VPQIFTLAFSLCQILGVVNGGIGKHVYDCSIEELQYGLSLALAFIQLDIFSILFTKISSLFFIQRITPESMVWTHRLIWAYMAFNIAWSITCSFVNFFPCKPQAVLWDIFVKAEAHTCINQPTMAIVSNGVFVLTDIGILMLPAYVVYHLQLPRHTKLGVGFLFALGIVMTAACAVKTVYFHKYYLSYDASC